MLSNITHTWSLCTQASLARHQGLVIQAGRCIATTLGSPCDTSLLFQYLWHTSWTLLSLPESLVLSYCNPRPIKWDARQWGYCRPHHAVSFLHEFGILLSKLHNLHVLFGTLYICKWIIHMVMGVWALYVHMYDFIYLVHEGHVTRKFGQHKWPDHTRFLCGSLVTVAMSFN